MNEETFVKVRARGTVGYLAVFVAVILTTNLCGAMWALLWPVITGTATEPSQLAVFVVGNLTGAVLGTIVGFLFGSSEGDRLKDQRPEA